MTRRILCLVLVLVLGALMPASGTRAADTPPAAADASPLPRFVSMKFNLTNVREGPGKRYKVAWVFQRKSMPVEVVQTFDVWDKVRDWEGTEGWVVIQAVSEQRGARTVIITGEIRALHDSPNVTAGLVARLEPGVIGKLEKCPASTPDWCRVTAGGYSGWLQRSDIWGVLPKEYVE